VPTTATKIETATLIPQPSPSATITSTPLPTIMPTTPLTVAWKFVFTSQGNLWIKDKNADANVIVDMEDITSVKISPDGSQIFFIRTNPTTGMELWSINSDGSELNQLIGEENFAGMGAIGKWSFSPGGKSIVFFFIGNDQMVSELWTVKLDGSGVKMLVGSDNLPLDLELKDESVVYFLPLTWVPNTNMLLFYPYPPLGEGSLFDPLIWVDVETGEFGNFLPEGDGGYISFSPDGSKYTVANESGVTLFDTDSKEVIKKMTFPFLKYLGNWLPDIHWMQDSSGFFVALPSRDAKESDDYTVPARVTIWKAGVEGSDPVEIVNLTTELDSISYSPDLEKIAHCTNDTIVVLDQTGSILQKLTVKADGFEMSEMYFKQWSPDSRHYTYLVGDGGCACGYDVIADISSDERLKIQNEPYYSGYVTGFITWLDPNTFLFYDYSPDDFTANLVLSELDGEDLSWPVEWDETTENPKNVFDFWVR
jgi:dipeptidyl aminopeptidase/acylaminoacyl peptidase